MNNTTETGEQVLERIRDVIKDGFAMDAWSERVDTLIMDSVFETAISMLRDKKIDLTPERVSGAMSFAMDKLTEFNYIEDSVPESYRETFSLIFKCLWSTRIRMVTPAQRDRGGEN